VHAGELLDGDAEGEVVPALPVVLARDGQAEQTHPPHLGDDLHRQAAGGVVLVAGGGDDLVGEVAHLGGQALVLLREHLGAGGRGGGQQGAHRRVSFSGRTSVSGEAAGSWVSARASGVRAWRSSGPSTIRPSWAKTPLPTRSAASSSSRARSTSSADGAYASRTTPTWSGCRQAVAVKPLAAASTASARRPS